MVFSRRLILRVEELESRLAPAAIRLDLVALHELGHSLGLEHNSNPSSIMYAYYNANYDVANFLSDPAVGELQALYTSAEAGPWKDSLDGNVNGTIELTYSYVPSGVRMDQGAKSSLVPASWKPTFQWALGQWSQASGGLLQFSERADAGKVFNYSGKSQNDPSSGDIRIAAHRMDGPGKVLAHTYFPPPNGATAAGDAHFDQAESWTTSSANSSTTSQLTGGPKSNGNNLVIGTDATAQANVRRALALALLGLGRDDVVGHATTAPSRALRPSAETLRVAGALPRASQPPSDLGPRGGGSERPILDEQTGQSFAVPPAGELATPARDATGSPKDTGQQPMAEPEDTDRPAAVPADPAVSPTERDGTSALEPLTAMALTLLGGFCVQPDEPDSRKRLAGN